MPLTTYTVTCTLRDFDASPLPWAPIVIRHVGEGLGAQGTVADGFHNMVTDINGVAVFQLVPTTGDYLGTHYEITSYHPLTGARIHKAAAFYMPEVNSDVDVLIESSIVITDPTPAVVAQLNAALATATAAAVTATGAVAFTATSAATATAKAAEAVISADSAAASATVATTKEGQANTSATNAAASEADALTSKNASATSASTASTAATTAIAKADEATTSATNAATSESDALASKNTAVTSATLASTSAGTATTKAAEASTSASNAAISESDALTSKNAAATSASTASTQASNASAAAASVSTAASIATTKASEASASAAAAALSAVSAAAGTVNNINGRTPVGGVVTLVPADIGAAATADFTNYQLKDAKLTSFIGLSSAVTGLLKITNGVISVDSAAYLTANQTINATGDVTGSGTTGIALTLATSGITAGTYNNSATQVRPITFDAKGRATGAGAAVTITPAFASITGLPTTRTGYGITDAASAAQGALADTALQAGTIGADPTINRIRTLALAGL